MYLFIGPAKCSDLKPMECERAGATGFRRRLGPCINGDLTTVTKTICSRNTALQAVPLSESRAHSLLAKSRTHFGGSGSEPALHLYFLFSRPAIPPHRSNSVR